MCICIEIRRRRHRREQIDGVKFLYNIQRDGSKRNQNKAMRDEGKRQRFFCTTNVMQGNGLYSLRHRFRSRHTDSVNSLAFSLDGSHLASGGEDGRLFVWRCDNGDCVYEVGYNHPLCSLLWHPREEWTILCGYGDGCLMWLRYDPRTVRFLSCIQNSKWLTLEFDFNAA